MVREAFEACGLGPGDRPCPAASSSAHVAADGALMACPALAGYDRNLRACSFREAWQGSPWLKEVRSVRLADVSPGPLPGPVPYRGHCHAQALTEHGHLRATTDWALRHREVLEELLSDGLPRSERT